MALAGRLHPLLVHFPIALVLAAAAAEGVAMASADARWRTVAVINLRTAAATAFVAAVAGWRLAVVLAEEPTMLLAWHRWLGTAAAAITVGAALAAPGADRSSGSRLRTYRITLFAAASLVGVAGHLGGLLVWGADFLRP